MEAERPLTVSSSFFNDFFENRPIHMVVNLLSRTETTTEVTFCSRLNKQVTGVLIIYPTLCPDLVEPRGEFLEEFCMVSNHFLGSTGSKNHPHFLHSSLMIPSTILSLRLQIRHIDGSKLTSQSKADTLVGSSG